MIRRRVAAIAAALGLLAAACGDEGSPNGDAPTTPAVLRASVEATKPHDPALFTQGLELTADTRYESSGGYGNSVVRATDRATGEVRATYALPTTLFAEGLTRVGDELVVLTWRERTAIVLDASTLVEKRRLAFDAEGWGICALGDDVVTSDGSAVLRVRDPATLAVRRSIDVRLAGGAVTELNELACTPDGVFANVWRTDRIVRIDPATGAVIGVLDVPHLRPAVTTTDPDAVLNGIARDPATGRFLLTGKRWPVEYDVQIDQA